MDKNISKLSIQETQQEIINANNALVDAIKNDKNTEQIMKYIIELKRHEININKDVKGVKPINKISEKERRAREAKRYKMDMARLEATSI